MSSGVTRMGMTLIFLAVTFLVVMPALRGAMASAGAASGALIPVARATIRFLPILVILVAIISMMGAFMRADVSGGRSGPPLWFTAARSLGLTKTTGGGDAGVDELKDEYVSGEIDQEEYEERLRDHYESETGGGDGG